MLKVLVDLLWWMGLIFGDLYGGGCKTIGGFMGFWELKLVGLWVVGGGKGWKWEEKGFNVSGFVK